jgi:hypothetical protein
MKACEQRVGSKTKSKVNDIWGSRKELIVWRQIHNTERHTASRLLTESSVWEPPAADVTCWSSDAGILLGI